MPDAMAAARQDVDQEAADELVRRQRHDLLAFSPVAAVILVAERHTALVEGKEPLGLCQSKCTVLAEWER